MNKHQFPVWDIPTRIFHWAIVCCVALAWWSGETENYDLHLWVGYTVLVLVSTRIAWGFWGSRHSRFRDFLVGPGAVIRYLRGAHKERVGHNPVGGWSVVLLLALLITMAVSGLFNTDDVLFSGPLYYAASSGFSDAMGSVHDAAFDALLAFVALHVSAVLFYQFVQKKKLLNAMVFGSVSDRAGEVAPVGWWRALVLLVLAALLLWVVIALAPEPAPVFW